MTPKTSRSVELVAIWYYPLHNKAQSTRLAIFEDDCMDLSVHQDIGGFSPYDWAVSDYVKMRDAILSTWEQADGLEYLHVLVDYHEPATLRKVIGHSWHKVNLVPDKKEPPSLVR